MYFSIFKRRPWYSQVVFGLILYLIFARNYITAQDDLRKRYETEAESKWNSYIKFADRLQGRVETVSKDHQANDKIILHFWVDFKHKQNLKLEIQQFFVPQTNGDCWVKNGKYAFTLKRAKESSPWIPTRIDDVLDDGKDIPYVRTFFGDGDYRNVCPLFIITNTWLPDLIKKPGSHIQKLERADHKDLELIRLIFSYTASEEEIKAKKIRPVKGWIVLVPDQFWRIYEYEMEAIQPTGDVCIIHSKVDCRINKEGYPIFTKLVKSIKDKPQSNVHYVWTEEGVIEERDPSSEEFTLSAFGLPEPPGVEWKKPFPWYLVVAALGAACLGVFFFLRARAHRLRGW